MGTDVDETHEQQLRDEAFRIFAVSQWVGPMGIAALTCVVLYVLSGEISGVTLAIWAASAFAAGASQALALAVPTLRNRRGRSGLPVAATVAHFFTGVVYGCLMWLDPVIVGDERLRWAVLMIIFAMAAGSVSGLSGLDDFILAVLIPLFTMSAVALMVRGQFFISLALLTFLTIQVVDSRQTGALWRELVQLRVDESVRAQRQRLLAEHDELTGLLNRGGLSSWLDGRSGGLSVMFLDLDHFKEVNDHLGHQAGDSVLQAVARRLSGLVRDGDAVVRLGGDEFLVVLAPAMSEEQAASLGRSMISAMKEPIVTQAGVAHVSASVGVATSRSDRHDARALISAADDALLEAKRHGRDQVRLSDDST